MSANDKGDLQSWLTDLGDIVRGGIGIFRDVRDILDEPDELPAPPPPAQPIVWPYSPNLQASDVFAMPNWYLVGAGLVILVLALLLRR